MNHSNVSKQVIHIDSPENWDMLIHFLGGSRNAFRGQSSLASRSRANSMIWSSLRSWLSGWDMSETWTIQQALSNLFYRNFHKKPPRTILARRKARLVSALNDIPSQEGWAPNHFSFPAWEKRISGTVSLPQTVACITRRPLKQTMPAGAGVSIMQAETLTSHTFHLSNPMRVEKCWSDLKKYAWLSINAFTAVFWIAANVLLMFGYGYSRVHFLNPPDFTVPSLLSYILIKQNQGSARFCDILFRSSQFRYMSISIQLEHSRMCS